ncbi:PepSY-associated TM helix domain-containing protein [Pseudoalteromonas luteoviolacea]|uniref:Membrane protein n=1 Tax=Pseudoalteromonas luteoviolacea H33 TaxID=1365251 RepID=A0A162AHP2_9GAMM|nr:PepSY-associated TM helix domain-containing protein [Pseudoalteromonas luteoviolacea]KZN50099.1 membrane protein [Pseudoalteromonas luteoviolacea H33]KZN76328.1 membrane protein [Pseudoalteromonas luteoviolacea H33-S]MBQ4877723.1 PepSY domain-containing protein [Pseudoalteromonas luteoviolacea]MBQ4906831.1 PepSY domain-containing protein [Pseudoalteromonas luteoviolacea]
MNFNKNNRSIHKWASIIISIPLLVIIVTGILLLVRKEFSFIQPPSAKGIGTMPEVTFTQILDIAKSVESAQIKSWDDVNRLDVRPAKGITKIRSNNKIEIQIDNQTGEILHIAKRNSELIESLHDGTFFEKNANLWLMLPVSFVTLVISITGMILFFFPYLKKRRKRQSVAS